MRSFYEYAIALVFEWTKPIALAIAFWTIAIPIFWGLHP
jgi:hypothetical protein